MIDLETERDTRPLPPLVEWRCEALRADGRRCRQVLVEYVTDGRVALRKRCDKCGAWNTTTR